MIYHTRGEHANHYTTDEPMIYCTRGEHANHYTTDAVTIEIDILRNYRYWYRI
jgi:cell wall-associated NlpC family hydrolase